MHCDSHTLHSVRSSPHPQQVHEVHGASSSCPWFPSQSCFISATIEGSVSPQKDKVCNPGDFQQKSGSALITPCSQQAVTT